MIYIWKILMYTVYYKNISRFSERFPAALNGVEFNFMGFYGFLAIYQCMKGGGV